jgi:ferredoxin
LKKSHFDLLTWPGLGRFLRWRHASTAMRALVLLVAALMVLHGLSGPRLAPKNLATVLTWLHLRGLLVLGLLLAGNLFCMSCPTILVRDLARRFLHLERAWPPRLRHKWTGVLLFALVLFAYELFDLWASPWWTAWLILAYFAGALLLGVVFRGAPFCQYVCPMGQFNLVSSLVSPLEVKVRDARTCAACKTKDCLRGRRDERGDLVQKGCEMGLYQLRKVGNMDCTLRLDCARACPHDNVGLLGRLPASELWLDPPRSGVGRFSQRPDLAALAALYTFGALINAFGMVSPVYELEQWLADRLSTRSEALVLGLIFVTGLVVAPAALVGLAAWLTRRWTGAQERLPDLMTRYAYALVPMGFGVWVAHFAFHFLTGLLTIVPVVQSALADLGWGGVGKPRWDLGAVVPSAWLFPIELGLLGLGWWGSLLVAYRLAEREHPGRPWPAFAPWALLLSLILLAAMWLMAQPMEMRGTFLQG